MNINSIQKHYDKLSTVERFKLICAAVHRGDEADADALRKSAPRKRWEMPNHYGIFEAWNFLASWHVMTMQENNSLYYLLLSVGDGEGEEAQEETRIEGYTWMDLYEMIQARTLARDIAWREVCKEYNIDPDKLIDDYPGAESVRFFVDVMKRFNEYNPVDVDPAEYIADFRGLIELKRKEWE